MKNPFKKIAVLTAIAAFATFNSYAQQPRVQLTPEQRADKMTSRYTEKLALSADQQAKIKDVLLKQEQQKQADMAAAGGDETKMRSLAKTRNENTRAQVKQILSPDQLQKLEALKKERRDKMRERRQQGDNQNPASGKSNAPVEDDGI